MDSKTRAKNKYNKANTRAYCLRLNLKTDKEIIEYLDWVSKNGQSKQGYIKWLILEDMRARFR